MILEAKLAIGFWGTVGAVALILFLSVYREHI
jgi:hypothetical protein